MSARGGVSLSALAARLAALEDREKARDAKLQGLEAMAKEDGAAAYAALDRAEEARLGSVKALEEASGTGSAVADVEAAIDELRTAVEEEVDALGRRLRRQDKALRDDINKALEPLKAAIKAHRSAISMTLDLIEEDRQGITSAGLLTTPLAPETPTPPLLITEGNRDALTARATGLAAHVPQAGDAEDRP